MTQYSTSYIPPTLTVDLVLFSIIDNQLVVLLMKRPNEPFRGEWALPGGYVPAGETTFQALRRIVHTKTGVNLDVLRYVEQLRAFDTVARDPRGHAVSVTYVGSVLELTGDVFNEQIQFFAVDDLPAVAFDHDEIIRSAHQRIAAEIQYTNLAKIFLPDTFTLTELQQVIETVAGTSLDKRNFRKRILNTGMLDETDALKSGGVHRPARLYRFRGSR